MVLLSERQKILELKEVLNENFRKTMKHFNVTRA